MILAPGVFIAGVVIFLIVIWDAFEAIILPRRVTRKFRLARFYYQFTWTTWRIYASLIPSKKRRESFLGFYGPISLLFLIAVWAVGLIISFAMMQYGAGSAVNLSGGTLSFYTDLYLSGTTFFTLGLGDVVPRSGVSRFLVVVESCASCSRIGSDGRHKSSKAIFPIRFSRTSVRNTTISRGSAR